MMINELCRSAGWQAVDSTAGVLLDQVGHPEHGLHSWQAYCDGVIGQASDEPHTAPLDNHGDSMKSATGTGVGRSRRSSWCRIRVLQLPRRRRRELLLRSTHDLRDWYGCARTFQLRDLARTYLRRSGARCLDRRHRVSIPWDEWILADSDGH